MDIPTQIDPGDIEIETCDEATPTTSTGGAAQRFYIVQQTPEGLVIQIAEQVDGNTVVTHSQPATTDLVTSALLNGGDLTDLVGSEVATSGLVVTGAVASALIGTDVGKVSADDDLTSGPVNGNEANEPVAVVCETTAVDDANLHDCESVHGGVATDHAYVGDGPKEHCVSPSNGIAAVSIPNTDTSGAPSATTIENTDSDGFTKSIQEDESDTIPATQEDVSEVMPNVQEHVPDIIVEDVQEQVSDIVPDAPEQMPNIVPVIQEQVSDIVPDVHELNGTTCAANEEVSHDPPQTVLQETADTSESPSEGVTKATPSRRISTRARKRRVIESPDVGIELSSGKLPPKMKAYQKWQRLPSNKDWVCVDKPVDKIVEKNMMEVDKRKPFTTCISNVCHAWEENDEIPLKPKHSLDTEKLNMADVTKVGSDVPKALTDVVDVHSLKAEVDQLQKLNSELKSRMKRLDRKSLLHNSDAKDRKSLLHNSEDRKSLLHNSGDVKVLSGGCERAMFSSGGINWKDMKFSVRKTTVSPKNISPKDKDSAENKAYVRKMDELATRGRELLHREEMTDRKEQRLKALDMELDRRSSIIKCREAKFERLEGQLKARENAVAMREKRLLSREHRETNGEEANERVAGGQPKDVKLNERERQVQAREKDLETKQQLLQATERQLTALGRELADKFHYLKVKQGGRDITSVSVAMASVVASQKGRAPKAAKKLAASAHCDGNNNDSTRIKPNGLGTVTQQSATCKETEQSALILLTSKITQLGVTKKTSKLSATKKVAKLGATKKVGKLSSTKKLKVAKLVAIKKVAKLGATKKLAKLVATKKLTKLGVAKKLTERDGAKMSKLGAAKISKINATKKLAKLNATKKLTKLNATKKLTKLNATKKMTKLNATKKMTKLSAAKKATKQPAVKRTVSIASERTNHPKSVMEPKKKTAIKQQVSVNMCVGRVSLSNH